MVTELGISAECLLV